MGAGAIFVLVVLVVALAIVAAVLYGFGASQWKRQTDAPEQLDEEREPPRPKHKVLDEKGNLVATESSDDERTRTP
jgi:uncharacterized protein HemX